MSGHNTIQPIQLNKMKQATVKNFDMGNDYWFVIFTFKNWIIYLKHTSAAQSPRWDWLTPSSILAEVRMCFNQ